ncbi:MAG: site-specific DNA-methyltransferase [Ideonella sp. WA131b]|nr:site-specific DNA-methyltransferase [Ideonella sp. WA131b]
MPTLDWLHREAAFRTAQQVPTRVLRPHAAGHRFGDGDAAPGNLLVQGDNLQALKALVPFYRGQVKCIFIDPPYNTKSAFEHYDDNLEHSQWLSMMLPRLQLLREFLREDGSIWVTIDDHEGHYLKVLMDEVFGRGNFIGELVWQKRTSRENRAPISSAHDALFLYGRNPPNVWKAHRNLLAANEAGLSNPDHDPRGPWKSVPFTAQGYRENQMYKIRTPTGLQLDPPKGRCWGATEPEYLKLRDIERRVYFPKQGRGRPRIKQFPEQQKGLVPMTLWFAKEVGDNEDAKKESLELFPDREAFGTPKPEGLLQRIVHIATNPGDLILDSFLGSGTTAAVAHKMGRRWIGIEMGEHAVTHCLPRLQKVVQGEQGGISQAVNWQGGGGFRFVQLGAPLFDEHGELHPEVRFADLAAFLWLRETGTAYEPAASPVQGTPLLGVHEGRAVYLLYNGILGDKRPAAGNVLTSAVLAAMQARCWHEGPKVVYGEACLLGDARLHSAGISFRQLPHAVPR